MVNQLSTFVPYGVLISDITLGVQTVITFSSVHVFTVGEIISCRVSPQYGTFELNNIQSQVIAVSTSTITLPINSTHFTPFISNPDNPQQLAMVVPSASGILPNASPPQTSLYDVFDNQPEV